MRLASLLLATLAACGGGAGGPDGGGDDATGGDGGADDPGYPTARVGQIGLIEQDSSPSAFAWMADRSPVPEEQRIDTAGDCALYVNPDPASCTPACTNGFCDDGTCVDYPARTDAGTITLTGLIQSFVFEPGEFAYAPEPYPSLPDLFADDAAISATAPGADAPGFTVSARGVEPLGADPGTIVLEDTADYELSWTAGSGAARIQLALRSGWHGAPYEMMLLCETADDGSLTIPVELITQLPDFGGPSLFPWPSEMTRFTRGVATTSAGPIELFVGSQRPVYWTHNAPE